MNQLQKRPVAVLAAAIAVTSLAAPALAGDKLPKGEKIMDMYVKSTGGEKAYKRVKNRVIEANMTMNMMGQEMKMSMKMYSAPPNKLYMIMESDMMGKMERGYDGKVAWSAHPMMGSQILSGDEGAAVKQESVFYKEVNWRDVYEKAETLEAVEFDGMDCYKVKLTPKEGNDQIAYYEKETWLQRGTEMTMASQMGEMNITTRLKDYSEVDGILMPKRIEQSMSGPMNQEVVITFDSIKHNVDLPDDRFTAPSSVQALIQDDSDGE